MRRVQRTKRRAKAGLEWTARDVALLVDLYPTCNNHDVAARLGRSEWAVVGKARGLGLTKDCERGYRRTRWGGRTWSSEETSLLRTLYPTTPDEEIAEQIGRTRNAVHMKARQLQLRKIEFWSEREDRYLRDAYRVCRCDEVARRLGRTLLAVKARAITLKLEPKVPQWSEDEVRFVREAYGTMDLEAIAGELGRTRAAVAKKAHRNGLVRFRHQSGQDAQSLNGLHPCCGACEGVEEQADDIRQRVFDSAQDEAAHLALYRQAPPAEPGEVFTSCCS